VKQTVRRVTRKKKRENQKGKEGTTESIKKKPTATPIRNRKGEPREDRLKEGKSDEKKGGESR